MTVEPSRDFPLNLLLEKGSYLTIITWSIKWPSRNFHTAFTTEKESYLAITWSIKWSSRNFHTAFTT